MASHTTAPEQPLTQADIRELARLLVENRITADEYFAAVDRRAQRLVDAETAGG